MIKKLRKKFIYLALSVVATVILVIVAGIDVANYINMEKEADRVISFVSRDAFAPPQNNGEEGPFQNGGQLPPNAPIDIPKNLPHETAFSARYFTVDTDKEGNVTSSYMDKISAVTADKAASYAAKATDNKGFVGNYRYKKVSTDTGYHYVFLDCEKEINACRTFIISSAIITSIGLAVISLLIIFLSKKVLAPVEESYQKQKRFITDAGHELKTPLTVISANAELLELDIGEGNEWLESIKGQVQRLGKLTKELVFLSRMDEGERSFDKAPFSLNGALAECAEGFRETALVAKKHIVTDLKDVTVTANEEMVRRAVNLVLDNAIKYAESEEIRLTLHKDGKRAIIEQSNAASLAKGGHDELFERFYRPDTSRSKATGGHGVGLSVVRSILEAHGGTASCESDGKQVTFRLVIPLAGK